MKWLKKLICKHRGHKWNWPIEDRCLRCGETKDILDAYKRLFGPYAESFQQQMNEGFDNV